MANVVIWVTLLLTARYAVQAALLQSGDVSAECTGTGATITLVLTNTGDDRPTKVYINGDLTTQTCAKDIAGTGDTQTVDVVFGECDITKSVPTTVFTLHFGNDEFMTLVVTVTCNDVKSDTKQDVAVVGQGTHEKQDNYDVPGTATSITMTVAQGQPTVTLGDPIELKLVATGGVTFEVIKCTVESTDVGGAAINAIDIITGWCAAEPDLLSNFVNTVNGQVRTSVSTITAFRLVRQGSNNPLTFKCDLKWCAQGESFCPYPDPVVCSAPVNRRRRSSFAEVAGDFAHEKTLTTSLKVYLPGMGQDSGTNAIVTNGHVMLVALLLCGFKYIM